MTNGVQNVDDIDISDSLLALNDVTFRRDGCALLSHVSWEVEPGQHWVVLGPNGAGKTTLVRLAGAEEFPTSGTIDVLGERIGRTDMRDVRAAIGMMSTALGRRIPPTEKVLDIVVSAGYAILGRWNEDYAEEDFYHANEVLERMGAVHLGERQWGALSEGERKRVLIARALMIDPELLLLDEPSAGLDLGGREDLVELLADLAGDEDAPVIVMITHHVEEIPEGFTHALLLDEGEVVASGPIDEVLTSENLSTTYHQSIELDRADGRFAARRSRKGGAHRR